jgi:hypothetical protein
LEPEEKEVPEPSTTAGGPAEQPSSSATNRQLELQRRRSLIVHNRLAKSFTWILLLGFVILPGTFSRTNEGGSGNRVIDEIANLPLYALPALTLPPASNVETKRLLPTVFLLLIVVLTCGHQPIDSRLVTSAAVLMHAQSAGSGILGRMIPSGFTSTSSPPG